MISKALQLRPNPQYSSSLRIQLVHGVIQDKLPVSLPANAESRWKDEPYSIISDADDIAADATICLFGVTEEGNSAMITASGYRPYVRVELPLGACTRNDAEALRLTVSKRLKTLVTLELESLKRFYGWVPVKNTTETQKFTYAILRFDSLRSASLCTYILEKEGYTITDKQVKPLTRFLNEFKITPSDWISVQNPQWVDTKLQRFSNCQMECTCNVSQISFATSDIIAPLLVMSFDGEMFSHDGSFPSPLKGDFTIAIGASFWTYGTPIDSIQRFVFFVGTVDEKPQSNLHVFCFTTKKEMIEGFRDFVSASDPDIVTGWNTYGFDYTFLYEDYESEFLNPWDRGSEELQISAITIARSVMGQENIKIESSSKLLTKARSLRGHSACKDWLKKAERQFGSRNIATLIKLENLTDGNLNTSLSEFGVSASLIEDDEDNAVICGLPAKTASEIRCSLRAFMTGKESASSSNFTTVLKTATPQQIEEFWSRMSIHGSSCKLLQLPTAPLGAKRGLYLGRFAAEKSELIEKRMSSSARGDNTYHLLHLNGRINIDLMQVIKDDKKPDTNTLKFAAEHWLGGGSDVEKLDLSAAQMFAAYASKDPKQCYDIAEYCSRDCDIPLLLIHKLSYIPTWIEMSRVCFTWTHEVINSGQQVKIFNLISRFVAGEYALNVRDSGWPTNSYDEFDEDDLKKRKPDYQGATVIEPIAGFYEDCITTLDFESLYPSIIRYFNLCPSVIILDSDILQTPSLDYDSHVIDHNILVNKQYVQEQRTYHFASHVQGVLPKLLKRLLDARKSVKKMMAQCEDPIQKAVLNGRQNGIKIACNSVYGFCGVSADRGLLPCKPVAAVTTLKGRTFIDATKSYIERTYEGSKVIYGDTDSVMIFWGKNVEVTQAAEWGEKASQEVTKLLRSGVILENTRKNKQNNDIANAEAVTLAYEKTYRPYLLLKKKNYAGLKHTNDGKGGFKIEIEMKGIDAVRRDRPLLLRTTSNSILHSLLQERSVANALNALNSSLQNIALTTEMDGFVLSKSLKSHYASSNLPHVMAWKRMGLRGEEQPPIGSRMPYIVVLDKSGNGGHKSSSKLYERTEHPQYVQSQKLKVDRQYYVESLLNPIKKLLQFVVSEQKIQEIFQNAIERSANTSSGISSLLNIKSSVTSETVIVNKPSRKRKIEETRGLQSFL
jgi:DNA polymerase elongation subunit (family B)